ncbi:MAG: hypothetical protein ACRDFA_10515 [bacterium]
MTIASGAATQRPRIVRISVARSDLGLAPVIIPVAVVPAAATATARRVAVPLLVS